MVLYGYNGYFKIFEEIVYFYNVWDVSDEFFFVEYFVIVNKEELGNFGLIQEEEVDIVVFMKILIDGYMKVYKLEKCQKYEEWF